MPVQMKMLLVAPSTWGKTSLLATAAQGLWLKRKLKTRVYTGDGGGWGPMQHLIDGNVVDAWNFANHNHPFETVRWAAQGAWPVGAQAAKKPEEREAILSDPTSKLEPLWLTTYVTSCPKCNRELYKGARPSTGQVACPTDKVYGVTKVTRAPNPANSLAGYGLVIYEGLTAFGEMMMDNMSDRSAKGEKMGEDVAVRFRDGDTDVAAVSRSSYSIAQRRSKDAVDESSFLTVPYCIWSATKDRGIDDDTKRPVFGPKLPGHAATDDAPRWFGPSLMLQLWPKANGLTERRVYLTSYYTDDNKGVEHKATTRLSPLVLSTKTRVGKQEFGTFPDYVVYDPSDPTLLWDIIEAIEAKQAEAKEMLLKGGTK